MPFLFHSKKQSIFDIKRTDENEQFYIKQQQKNQSIKDKNLTSRVNLQVCRIHPFRSQNQANNESDHIDSMKQATTQDKPSQQKLYKYKLKRPVHTKQSSEQKSLTQESKKSIALIIPQSANSSQPIRLHKNHPPQISSKRNNSISKQSTKSLTSQLNKFQTPGPGQYQTEQFMNKQNKIKYGPFKTQPLPPVKPNLLNAPIKQWNENQFTFSYKDQTSAVFKAPKTKSNKSNNLMAIIFGKKNTQKDIEQQTNCQSRHRDDNICDQNYEKAQSRSPSPCSYDPNINLSKACSKKGIFISNQVKFFHSYAQPNIPLQNAKLSQNQSIITHQKPNRSASPIQSLFISSLPRQLHFDTQLYGTGQFYYSPKNNISDGLDKERRTGFGSNLQRFILDQVHKEDPYKYCYAKVQYHKNKPNYCPSLSFKAKRQLFKPLENMVAPNQYSYTGQTVSKGVQDIVLQQLLQQKYSNSVGLMRKQKQSNQKILHQQYLKKMDLSTPISTPRQQLQPNRYYESHLQHKQLEKQNISFGLKKDVIIDRGFKARKELDKYYQVGGDWEKTSFNRAYGYQLFQVL